LFTALYTAGQKVATAKWGLNTPALGFVGLTSMIAVVANLIYLKYRNWYSWERVKNDWPRLMFAGLCTSAIIISGLLMLSIQEMNVMTATAIIKGVLIPIGVVVALCRREQISRREGLSALIAFAAVMLAALGSAYDGFHFWSVPIARAAIIIYVVAYTARMFVMRGQKGDKRHYCAGEQLFAASGVFLAVGSVFFLPAGLLPHELVGFRSSILGLSPIACVLALISGICFGLYAPYAVMILMHKLNGVSAPYAATVHKTVAFIGGVLSNAVLWLIGMVVWFFTSHKGPSFPNWVEWLAMAALLFAVLYSWRKEPVATLSTQAVSVN
jgi:drug/metabolite transporter (DMT)-like permease